MITCALFNDQLRSFFEQLTITRYVDQILDFITLRHNQTASTENTSLIYIKYPGISRFTLTSRLNYFLNLDIRSLSKEIEYACETFQTDHL